MESVVGILLWLGFGFVAGALAKFIMPGKDPGGIIVTILLGIAGAFVGGMIGRALGFADVPIGASGAVVDWRSLMLAIGGALLLLLAYRAFRMVTGAPSTPALGLTSGNVDGRGTSSGLNLVEGIRNSVTHDVVDKLSSTLGEAPSNVRKAIETMIPTILAGAVSEASTSSGAARILDMAKDATQGGKDLMGNLTNELHGAGIESLSHAGQGILTSLFGDKTNNLINWFCRFAGIKPGSASTLMAMAGNLVMSGLGKQVMQNGLNASGLASLLTGQKGWLSRLLPAGIGEVPGLSSLASITDQAGAAVRGAGQYGDRVVRGAARGAYQGAMGVANAPTPWAGALVPLALIALAFLALPFILRAWANRDVVAQAPDTRSTARERLATNRAPDVKIPDAGDTSVRVASYGPNAGKLAKALLPGGLTLEFPEGSFLDGMHKYLADAGNVDQRSFNFEGLAFDGNQVKPSPGLDDYVTALAALLKAFPKTELRIESHSDNEGDLTANKRMTQERADAVKALLVRFGAPADRITAVGMGGEKPMAPNDTAEGRAKNRRIELHVAKK